MITAEDWLTNRIVLDIADDLIADRLGHENRLRLQVSHVRPWPFV